MSISSENEEIKSELHKIIVGMSISSSSSKDIFSYLGQTEILEDENFKFHTTFVTDYFFERNQYLKFEIIQKSLRLETVSCTLGRIMGARNQTAQFPFKLQNIDCLLTICGRQVKEVITNNFVSFNINCRMNESDEYFLIISSTHQTQDGKGQRIYKSEERRGIDLRWIISGINLNDLCAGDTSVDIIFEFFKPFQGSIGKVKVSLDKIKISLNSGLDFMIISSENAKIGSLNINFDIYQATKFLDYLEQGLQISLFVGIDYTASNGQSNEQNSLHFIYGKEPNQYEQAIRSCGGVVAYYDYDGLFPVYGFGGILKKSTMANHCFNCNMQDDPNVSGVEGIIHTYKQSLNLVQFDGPTYFSPLIKGMIDNVRVQEKNSKSSVYYILLILTDGQIHDMQSTKDALCEAATLPISVIIIGVGDADFANMVELDGDKIPLRNKNGEKIERDIVQFVCYNDFKMEINRLAAEVLYEIPGQIENYYLKYKNFKPFNF
jgi:hypothetical protein